MGETLFLYENKFFLSPTSSITIEVQTYWWTPRTLTATKGELSLKGKFRCYVCGDSQSWKHYGGATLKQRICRFCYPWVDESWVGAIIRWDERHGFTQFIRD